MTPTVSQPSTARRAVRRIAFALSATAVAVTLTATPAAAQTYGVQVNAYTGGMPGAGTTYSGYQSGQTAVYAEHDPAGTGWVYNGTNHIYSDAGAKGWAAMGALYTELRTDAQGLQARGLPGPVTTNIDARFDDRVTVASDTLPVGTPVTLTFQALTQVQPNLDKQYQASITCQLTVGAATVSSPWTVRYGTSDPQNPPPAVSPTLTVNTKVGSKLTLSGRLTGNTRAWFLIDGGRDGLSNVDASCRTPFLGSASDVYLVADSGHSYAP